MIRFIRWKQHVTPTEAVFLAQWIALKQGAMPSHFMPELPA